MDYQEGKDVVARAKTGSGKTFAYLLPLLHRLFNESSPQSKLAPAALVLVPTRELCQQACFSSPHSAYTNISACDFNYTDCHRL